MNANEYQTWTRSTAIYPKDKAIPYLILGLLSEAGEVAGKYKKDIRDNGGNLNVMALMDEIGDCFWYLARICDELNFSMENVMHNNMMKLEDRKARNKIGGSGDKR